MVEPASDSAPTSTEAAEAPEATKAAKPGRMKGGMDAAEMSRRRWALERERKAAQAEADSPNAPALLVRCTLNTSAILKRLERDAKSGNVMAARELRGWLKEVVVETDTDISALDKRTRQGLLARLLDEMEAAQQEAEQGTEGEGADSPTVPLST